VSFERLGIECLEEAGDTSVLIHERDAGCFGRVIKGLLMKLTNDVDRVRCETHLCRNRGDCTTEGGRSRGGHRDG